MAAYLFVIRIPTPEAEATERSQKSTQESKDSDNESCANKQDLKANDSEKQITDRYSDTENESIVKSIDRNSETESNTTEGPHVLPGESGVENTQEELENKKESENFIAENHIIDKNAKEQDESPKKGDSGNLETVEQSSTNVPKSESEDNPKLSSESDIQEKYEVVQFIEDEPLLEITKGVLDHFGIENVSYQKSDNGKCYQITFVDEGGDKSESILNRLAAWKIGDRPQTSICIFPADIYRGPVQEENIEEEIVDERNDNEDQIESKFKKSIKARMLVTQVVSSVKNNAEFTFDYLLLTILASMISALGLAENSSVILVASMLVSPLMGPILAGTFGTVIKNASLRNLGIKSELKGLFLCLISGFIFGLISGGISLNGAGWGSTNNYPSDEMKSRGMLRSLWVGMLIALPSGAGVALSVLGDNTGSLVGVAISASLLPPAVNAGMLWAFSVMTAISPPEHQTVLIQNTSSSTNETIQVSVVSLGNSALGCARLVDNKYEHAYSCNMSHDMAMLGLISLCLTLLNITCIFIMGIIVLKIKEVAPQYSVSEGTKTFWEQDIQIVRESYATTKGKDSITLAQQAKEIYSDWKKQQGQNPAVTLRLQKIIEEVENSPDVLNVQRKIPGYKDIRPFSNFLAGSFQEAQEEMVEESYSDTVIMKDTTAGYDVYKTFHGKPSFTFSHSALKARSRNRFNSHGSDVHVINESNENICLEPLSDGGLNKKLLPSKKHSVQFQIGKPASSLFHRRQKPQKKERFEIHRVHEPAVGTSSSATQPLLTKAHV